MRLVGLLADDPVTELVLGHRECPDAALYRVDWITGRPLRAECRNGDVMVTLEARSVSPVDTPPIDRMVVYEGPGTDEVPLVRQRVGVCDTVLSERGLLGTATSRLTGAPGAQNLPGGGLDAGEEPTTGPLRGIHKETNQQVIPGRLLTLQSDHWIGRAPSGGLEDYRAPHIIYSATREKPGRPRVRDLERSTTRVDWVPMKSWHRIPWTRVARRVLSQHLPSR